MRYGKEDAEEEKQTVSKARFKNVVNSLYTANAKFK